MDTLVFKPVKTLSKRYNTRRRRKEAKRTPLVELLFRRNIQVINKRCVEEYKARAVREHIEEKAIRAVENRYSCRMIVDGGYPDSPLVWFILAAVALSACLTTYQTPLALFCVGVVVIAGIGFVLGVTATVRFEKEQALLKKKKQAEIQAEVIRLTELNSALPESDRWKILWRRFPLHDFVESGLGSNVPAPVLALAHTAETDLPGARAVVEYFDHDPFLIITHQGEEYYVAVWGERGFRIGSQ